MLIGVQQGQTCKKYYQESACLFSTWITESFLLIPYFLKRKMVPCLIFSYLVALECDVYGNHLFPGTFLRQALS